MIIPIIRWLKPENWTIMMMQALKKKKQQQKKDGKIVGRKAGPKSKRKEVKTDIRRPEDAIMGRFLVL